jgi:HK97 family phage major capsid protein
MTEATPTVNIAEQMSQLSALVSTMQKKHNELEARPNGINAEEAKKMQKDIADLGYSLQEQKAKIEEAQKAANRINAEGGQVSAKYAEGFEKYIRHCEKMPADVAGEVCQALAEKHLPKASKSIIAAQAKTLMSTIMPDGGYFITPERSAFIVNRIFETSPLRRVANVITTTSNEVEMIIDDNEATSGGWRAENGTVSETATPQVGLLKIPVHEQYAMPLISDRMIQDAGFDVEGWLAEKIADKLSRAENTAFITGNGAMKPRGILSLSAWTTAGTYERGKIEQKTTAAGTTIAYEDLVKLQGAVKEAYQPRAVWLVKRDVWAEKIMTLKDTSDFLFAMNSNNPFTILGKQVVLCDDMTGLTTGALVSGALSVAFGDFGVGYTIVDRLGISVLRDPYTTKGFVKYYTTKRVGGDVSNYESFKLLKIQ